MQLSTVPGVTAPTPPVPAPPARPTQPGGPLPAPTAATPVPHAPPAPRDDSVVDDFHGTKVADPFRPLEQLDAPATTGWWKANNQRTEQFLARANDARIAATTWHTDIRNYTRESMETRHGDVAVFSRQSGLESQPTFYVRDLRTAGAQPRVLLDPKTLSADGTMAVSTMDVSPDGRIAAYTLSEAGSDMQTMRFRDVATGADVHEELPGLRFTNATWDPDGKGVTYTKSLAKDKSVDGMAFGVFHHVLGTPMSQDRELFSMPQLENSSVDAMRVHPEDPYLFFRVSSGTNPETGVFVQRPGAAKVEQVVAPGIAEVTPFHREGETLFAVTDQGAPRKRVVAIDMNAPAIDNWKTVVPEGTEPGSTITSAQVAGGKLVLNWAKGGADAMEVRAMDGTKLHDVPLPVASTVAFGDVKPGARTFEMSIGGYLTPGDRYRYDVDTNELTFVKKNEIPSDLTKVAEVERKMATSKDGTQIPMWVVKPKGMKLDGTTPTILYSYGGFNNPLTPGFSYQAAHWVSQGGVWVVANLRGGGEFGKEWYDGGRLKNKQNTFDDLAATAKQLFADGITSPQHLAINGGSNGGLTTAVTSQQYPELFGAVVSEVPVTDMLRFHTNNFGAAWMSDYGDPRKKEDFDVSFKYSPLHNVRPASEVRYPPTLVMTGDHDDRVAPWHAMKWAAARQAAGQMDNTFLRVAERAGHGAGKPTTKVIEEAADRYAFYVQTIGQPTPPR